MTPLHQTVQLTPEAQTLLDKLLNENPRLRQLVDESSDIDELLQGLRDWAVEVLGPDSQALAYQGGGLSGHGYHMELSWRDLAAIRVLDMCDAEGRDYVDRNAGDHSLGNRSWGLLWDAHTGSAPRGAACPEADYFTDLRQLFAQLSGRARRQSVDRGRLEAWMRRFPSGLNAEISAQVEANKQRIVEHLIRRIEQRDPVDSRYHFAPGLKPEQKREQVRSWWQEHMFHLRFAIRSTDELAELLEASLGDETLATLRDGEAAGLPIFINPYYLSLLHVDPAGGLRHDQTLRDYVLYSRELVEEFGQIRAWEKEDIVEAGKPNAAGWILPRGHAVHRRYPDVAILIPQNVSRACGGLCTSCQRMYGFQKGELNFDLGKLEAGGSWQQRLDEMVDYWRHDTQLRDILITGGDALMASDRSLAQTLDAVLRMAADKREANQQRPQGEKWAELQRIRLGTRLPIYLPQRITAEFCELLHDFKRRAREVGVRQFFIQTHFESPLEVTRDSASAIRALIGAGWTVVNQHVFTTAASRRGHNARLRQVLNELGVLCCYTFGCKGFRENRHNFATNARAVQEQHEEKSFGRLPASQCRRLSTTDVGRNEMPQVIEQIMREGELPFLATDRSVLNLPGVGKSLTFRTIGLTADGRRILRFEHDLSRRHSPIIKKMGAVTLVESKSIAAYLRQIEAMGEDVADYADVWGYALGETEPRLPAFEYPDFGFELTAEINNIELSDDG